MKHHVDVAARGQGHRAPRIINQTGTKGSNAHSPRSFDDLLIIVIGRPDAVGDLGFIDQNEIIGQIATHIKCVLVVFANTAAQTIGQCWQFLDRGRFAFLQACDHGTAAFHGDADHANVGIDRFCHQCNTGQKPTT